MLLSPLQFARYGIKAIYGLTMVNLVFAHPGRAQVVFVPSEDRQLLTVEFSDQFWMQPIEEGTIKAEDLLKVYTAESTTELAGKPAILGIYRIQSQRLTFKPVVPFSESVSYLAIFADSIINNFRYEPQGDRIRTRVEQVYPTTDTIPANLLKVYLEFSAPMREGEVYHRVKILKGDGNIVRDPFVPLQPELWDSSRHRVTLWLDPGRVKRSLGSRETHGPVIEEGQYYRLSVDSLWKDALGYALNKKISKKFFVVSADREHPQVGGWELDIPEPLTLDPLVIEFNESLDLATAQKAFTVWTAGGELLSGLVDIQENETIWRFIPKNQWKPGSYKIRVLSTLEDLAGNNLNRVFDRDISKNPESPPDNEFYWLEFDLDNEM